MKVLPLSELTRNRKKIPVYTDHVLATLTPSGPFHCETHYTGLGIISLMTGKGHFNINDHQMTLNSSSFLIVNRGSKLSFTLSPNSKVVFVGFNPKLSKLVSQTMFSQNKKRIPDKINIHDYALIEHIHIMNSTLKNHLEILITLSDSCASFHALKTDMVIRSILDELIHENYDAISYSSNLTVVKKNTQIHLYKKLSVTKRWIEQNYGESISIDHLADIAMLNNYHFLRLFKQAFGITPHQFLIKTRLKNAKRLLKNSTLSISEICHRVGFESVSSFSILFKRRFSKSPTEYRRFMEN